MLVAPQDDWQVVQADLAIRPRNIARSLNAAKGVLVTTSWVGKASRDFAARNGNRIQIIEGRELKHLLREHLGIDALISLPKLPPGWEQHDIT